MWFVIHISQKVLLQIPLFLYFQIPIKLEYNNTIQKYYNTLWEINISELLYEKSLGIVLSYGIALVCKFIFTVL